MAITFKNPDPSDITTMQEFADIIEKGLSLLGGPTVANVSHVVASKLQEALFWFSHGVLNKPIVADALEVASVVATATGNTEVAGAVNLANTIEADAAAVSASVAPSKPIAS